MEGQKAKIDDCLRRFKALSSAYRSDCLALQEEIDTSQEKVDKLTALQKYFQKLHEILKVSSETEDEHFTTSLAKQEWKLALSRIVQLIDMKAELRLPEFRDSNCFVLVSGLLKKRLVAFHSVLEGRIKTLIDGLGWPKIVSNSETAEIISRLQELLTYGEAIYILKGDEDGNEILNDETYVNYHPLEYFIEPIRLRFKYHFDSDRPTNQLTRPDWYFDHLLVIVRENVSFLKEFIFPCWRLRFFDDFLRDGPLLLATEKTRKNLASKEDELQDQKVIINHLVQFGKFRTALHEEFGYLYEGESEIDLFGLNEDAFIEGELDRIKSEYAAEIESFKSNEDAWISPHLSGKDPIAGDPGPIVLKFLSLFNAATVVPYSFITSLACKARLLARVQSWLLERFHEKCQFDCSPHLRKTENEILKDIAMINSLLVLCKVLRDDFGESMVICCLACLCFIFASRNMLN
jgi:hypothetical protein